MHLHSHASTTCWPSLTCGLNGALPGRAQLCSPVCLRFCQPFLLQPELSFLILNSASLVTKLFSSMGINRPIDKLIVQKVFEMIKAGKSHSQIGDFFHHTRQWVQHLLTNYSPTSCSPVSVRNRGPRRKTTREEDQLIIQKAREKAHAPVFYKKLRFKNHKTIFSAFKNYQGSEWYTKGSEWYNTGYL